MQEYLGFEIGFQNSKEPENSSRLKCLLRPSPHYVRDWSLIMGGMTSVYFAITIYIVLCGSLGFQAWSASTRRIPGHTGADTRIDRSASIIVVHYHHLVQLLESNVVGVGPEALSAHVEPVLPDQTMLVGAHTAASGTLSKFPCMAKLFPKPLTLFVGVKVALFPHYLAPAPPSPYSL